MSQDVARAIVESLSKRLLTPDWRRRTSENASTVAGHCYIASEAYYHLCGGRDAGLQPYRVEHEDASHWFIMDTKTNSVIDLTAEQFDTPVPYQRAKAAAFLTPEPSQRTRILMGRARLRLESS